MADQNAFRKPCDEAGTAAAVDGVVVLDGPDGVAVTMTVDAALRTAQSLQEAAERARLSTSEDPTPGNDHDAP